jgi:Fic family protein
MTNNKYVDYSIKSPKISSVTALPSSVYRNPASMEPLLPAFERGKLSELSFEIIRKSGELKCSLPSPLVRGEVAKLVREMNSYYSNLIEGHKTLPRDIEKALRMEFSEAEDDRRNQRLSVAHIETEAAMREGLEAEPETEVFSADFLCRLHREFYSHLLEGDRFTTSQSGVRHPLEAGTIRDYNVDVGRHTPPDHSALRPFLDRFRSFYSSESIPATDRLIALAAAHHRLAWIHPFGDGNGRVARLQSQGALIVAGLDGEGLWTLSRGLARAKPAYYQHLQAADQPRANDFDGRGNLSDKGLSSFCQFFLERILDQIEFMIGLIAPFSLLDRIDSYLRFTRVDLDAKMRGHLGRLLKALCLEGEVTRGEVPGILGLKGTAGREVIKKALAEGLVSSPSPKGRLKIAFPNKVVDSYFPQLFTDLPVDAG